MADKNNGSRKSSPSEPLCKCKDEASTGKTSSKGKAMPIGSPIKTRSRTKAMAVVLPVQSSSKARSSSSKSRSSSSSKASASASKARSSSSSKASASASKARSSSSSKSPSLASKARSSSSSKSPSLASKASVSATKAPRKSKTTTRKPRVSRKRVYKAISKSKAQQAFKEYYANRDYSSESRRNAAMKRDLNTSPRNASKYLVKDERYLLSPGRYDYPGVDAGPNVSKYSGNLAALKLAHKAPRSGRRSHSQVLKEIKRSK